MDDKESVMETLGSIMEVSPPHELRSATYTPSAFVSQNPLDFAIYKYFYRYKLVTVTFIFLQTRHVPVSSSNDAVLCNCTTRHIIVM